MKKLTIVLLLLSGYFSAISDRFDIDPEFLIFLIPGILFGIALAPFFVSMFRGHSPWVRIPLWIICSAGAYYAAWWTAFYMTDRLGGFGRDSGDALLFFGGFVGSLILAFTIRFLFTKITPREMCILIVAGTLLSFSWKIGGLEFIEYNPYIDFYDLEMIFLFIPWQLGMGLLITHFVSRNNKLMEAVVPTLTPAP